MRKAGSVDSYLETGSISLCDICVSGTTTSNNVVDCSCARVFDQ